jgi:hypothetical protein
MVLDDLRTRTTLSHFEKQPVKAGCSETDGGSRDEESSR